MQRTLLTAVIVLFVSAGIVNAQNGSGACGTKPAEEETVAGLSLEVQEGVYFYVPQAAEDMDKLGFWEERNDVPSLQTEECWRENRASRLYPADFHREFPVA